MLGPDEAGDQVVLVFLDAGHSHVGGRAAARTVQPNRDVGQGHALHLWHSGRVPEAHWESSHLAAILELMGDHVHGQALLGACRDFQAPASSVVPQHGRRHAVHEVVLLGHVLREEDAHAFIDLAARRLQLACLEAASTRVVVRVGLIVERQGSQRPLVPILEERLGRQVVDGGRPDAAARDHGGVLVASECL